MKINKKFTVVVLLGAMVVIASAFSSAKDPAPLYTNLKVLPKNISSKELQGLMVDDFQDALGVTCDFCHASATDGHGLDFASDAKPEKEIARTMMRTTLGINKKYFKVKHPVLGSASMIVTCNTCHKGQPFPGDDTGAK